MNNNSNNSNNSLIDKLNLISNKNITDIKNIANDIIDDTEDCLLSNTTYERAMKCLTQLSERIVTGIYCFDELFTTWERNQYVIGMERQDVILLAGMSGVGKTSFAMTLFSKLYELDQNPYFFSFDMKEKKVWNLFIKSMFGHNDIIDNPLFTRIMKEKRPHIIHYDTSVQIRELDKFLTDKATKVIFIDYIDKLFPTFHMSTEKEMRIQLMKEIKALARKHNCTIILLSQSTEDKSYRHGRPTLANIYGGKEIRSDVDFVIAVYRNKKYNEFLPLRFHNVTEIIMLKSRADSRIDEAYIKYEEGRCIELSNEEIAEYNEVKKIKNK